MEKTIFNNGLTNTMGMPLNLSNDRKELLLYILRNIGLARNWADIAAIVHEKIKPVLLFDNYCILAADEGCSVYSYGGHSNGRCCSEAVSDASSLLRELTLRSQKANTPVFIDYTLDDLCCNKDQSLIILAAGGCSTGLAIPLKAEGKAFGCFVLNFAGKTGPGDLDLLFLQAITEQLSTTLAHILSNEKTLHKERDFNNLLQLIEDLPGIRQREDLARVIKGKIKPILEYDDAVIIILDKHKRTARHFLNIATDERRSHPFYNQLVQREFPLEGTPAQQLCNYPEDIHYWSVAAYLEHYPESTPLLFMQQTGLHHSLSVKLWRGGDLLGLFMLHFGHRSSIDTINYDLIKAVGNQVAVAVANILATEDVLQREKEKMVLLSISEAINSIHRKEDLLRVISEKIKPLFIFNDVVIALVNPDQKTHRAFLLHPDEKRLHQPSFAATADKDYPVEDGVFDQALKAGKPVVFNVKEAMQKFPAAGYLTFIYINGIREMLTIPLRYAPGVNGLLILQSEKKDSFFEKDFKLLQAISEQLAVAVANILITEEMNRKQEEKSIQLSIIHHLTHSLSWEQWFGLMAKELQKIIPFRFAYFSCKAKRNEQGYGHGYLHINKEEYQYVNKEHFLRLLHLDDHRFMHLIKPDQANKQNGNNDDEAFRIHTLIAEGLDLHTHMSFTHHFAEYGLFYISLFNTDKNSYKQKDRASFYNILSCIIPNIEKNLHSDEIIRLKEKLEHEKIYLEDEIKSTYNFDEMIGTSEVIRDVYKKARQVARTDVTVLITGETGTGKELLARAVHNYSDREKNVMVKVNCAVLPMHLIESELFGHEKGAFTGAIDRRLGKFEIANGSTLFLDEIGELPLDLQAKLLRVLQEKEFERLGSNKVIKTDVRIVAATNRNLEKEVMEGRFRSDLYYRLSVFPIELPPLRERMDDIPLLARHFIEKYNRKFNKAVTGFSNDMMKEILRSQWPGNIREMEHLIERAVMLCSGKVITTLHQTKKYQHNQPVTQPNGIVIKSLAQSEKEHILNILKITNGRIRGVGGAAELLNIKPTTLEARMKKLGVEKRFTG